MAAGTAYAKRYAGGFADGSAGGTPEDSAFLNAVETALLQLIGAAPTVDGQVAQWDNANTRFGPALILNKNVDPAAAIAKSKLDFTGANGIVNADIAGAAAIAKSKLASLAIVDADVAVGAAIQASKITGLYAGPTTQRKTTAKTVNTTVAATDLLNSEITIAANSMGTSGLMRLTAWGDWLQNSGAVTVAPRLQLLLGGTTLLDTGVGPATGVFNTATRLGWRVTVEIFNLGAANVQSCFITLDLAAVTNVTSTGSLAFTTGEGTYGVISGPAGTGVAGLMRASGWNSAAKDTTGALALVLNVINPSASAACETKLVGAYMDIF